MPNWARSGFPTEPANFDVTCGSRAVGGCFQYMFVLSHVLSCLGQICLVCLYSVTLT